MLFNFYLIEFTVQSNAMIFGSKFQPGLVVVDYGLSRPYATEVDGWKARLVGKFLVVIWFHWMSNLPMGNEIMRREQVNISNQRMGFYHSLSLLTHYNILIINPNFLQMMNS